VICGGILRGDFGGGVSNSDDIVFDMFVISILNSNFFLPASEALRVYYGDM
jgi:hypothetical protein